MNSSISALKFGHTAPATRVSSPSPAAQPGRLSRWGTAVWRSLEAVGRARARRELLVLADRWQLSQPALAAELRAACRDQAGV